MQVVASHRASDSDREQVAERLRRATTEGRLTGDEFEQRLDRVYAARTYGELNALVDDLPDRAPLMRPRVRIGLLVGAVGALLMVVIALGVLASMLRGHAAVAILDSGHQRRLNLPGPLAGPHQGLIIAGALAAAVAALSGSAALLWAFMSSRFRRPA